MRIRLHKKIDFTAFIKEKYEKKGYNVKITSTKNSSTGKKTYYIDVTDKSDTKKMYCEYDGWFASQFETVIAYVCPNCGCEIFDQWAHHSLSYDMKEEFGSFKSMNIVYNDYVKTEINEIQNLSVCPACGKELTHDKGFYIEGHTGAAGDSFGMAFGKMANNPPVTDSDGQLRSRFWGKTGNLDVYFKEMKTQRETLENASFNSKIDSNVSMWKDTFYPTPSIQKTDEIKNDISKLKEHILNIITLEVNTYSLSKRLLSLYAQQVNLNRMVLASQCKTNLENRKKVDEIKDNIEKCILELEDYKKGKIGMQMPSKPLPPEYATPNLFNKKKVLAENETLRAHYEKELEVYQQKVNSYESKKRELITKKQNELDKLNAELSEIQNLKPAIIIDAETAISKAKQIVDNETADAEVLLQKVCDCLAQYYSFNIVFSKYRDLVSLSTFYEYLMAGRCTSLEGANGAYNLYENEIRANMIIDKLTTVIEKLDDIKDSQYLIYSQLQTVNKNLERLNSTMDSALVSIKKMDENITTISQNTEVIAHNTAVTAYYSKLNAELTNSLGYLVAFK